MVTVWKRVCDFGDEGAEFVLAAQGIQVVGSSDIVLSKSTLVGLPEGARARALTLEA